MSIVKTNVNHPELFLNPFKNVQETQEVISVTSVTPEEIHQTILEILSFFDWVEISIDTNPCNNNNNRKEQYIENEISGFYASYYPEEEIILLKFLKLITPLILVSILFINPGNVFAADQIRHKIR